ESREPTHSHPACGAASGGEAERAGYPGPQRARPRLRSDLDLDVDAGGEVEALGRLHGLSGGPRDVEETLVDPHLEVLAGVLVLVRRPDDAVLADLGRQRHGTPNLRLGADDRLDDLLRRLVDHLVVVGPESDPDLLASRGGHGGPR